MSAALSYKYIKSQVPRLHIDTDKTIEIGKKFADLTGRSDVNLVLELAQESDIGQQLIEELLSDHLDAEQLKHLQKWETKIDMAI